MLQYPTLFLLNLIFLISDGILGFCLDPSWMGSMEDNNAYFQCSFLAQKHATLKTHNKSRPSVTLGCEISQFCYTEHHRIISLP